MQISLLILAAPDTAASWRALAVALAMRAAGHGLQQVFFQAAGVLHAQADSPWLALADKTDLVLCSAAVVQHGLDDGHHESVAGFAVGGLVQLIDAASTSDRVLVFGP